MRTPRNMDNFLGVGPPIALQQQMAFLMQQMQHMSQNQSSWGNARNWQ